MCHQHDHAKARENKVDEDDDYLLRQLGQQVAKQRYTQMGVVAHARGRAKKGDVLAVAQLAGIMAAKKTSDLVPLCHPLLLTKVTVDLTAVEPDRVEIEATVKLSGQTGVEMEALTAVSVAALTVYDMCKAVDRGMQIKDIRVVHKDGGKSGEFRAE